MDSFMKLRFIPKRILALAFLLGACTILAYLPALNLGFVNWDDDEYVYKNSNLSVLNGRFIRWAFTTFQCGNWHPLTWFSLGLDRLLWGTGPMGFHATNVVLHALNTMLVTVLAGMLFTAGENSAPGSEAGNDLSGRATVAAAVTGILFGFHPIHVESVAWISERKDLLCAFFFFAGLLTYLTYAWRRSDKLSPAPCCQTSSSRFYLLTLLLFIFSLLSKPMAVTFPVILLILDWYPLGRFKSQERCSAVLMEKLPFFALSLASSIMTIIAQKSAISPFTHTSFVPRLLIGIHALVMYLWKMLVPVNLLPYYPYPRDIYLLSPEYLLALLVAAGITISCMVLFVLKRSRFWIAAWGYYLVTLLPVLGIIQVGMQSMADRYTYLPSLGPFLLSGLGIAYFVNRKGVPASQSPALRYSTVAALGILALTLSFLTMRQAGIWKDGLTFWNYVIEKEPGVVDVAYNNRALIYLERGLFKEALQDCNTTISINHGFAPFYFVRAEVYNRLGEYDNTLGDLTTALKLSPDYVLGYVYRSMMYNWLGDHDKALEDLTTAVTMKPDYVLGYYHRGNTNLSIGQYGKAIADFSKAIALDPENAYVYINRGTTYYKIKKYDNAVSDFSKALMLVPNCPKCYVQRAKAYLKSGRKTQAYKDFDTACKMGYQEACRISKLNAPLEEKNNR